MLWCKVLLLLRNLNSNLMEEDLAELPQSSASSAAIQIAQKFEVQAYIKQLLNFLSSLGVLGRLTSVLTFPFNENSLSQAYLEEAHLTMDLVS